MCTNVKHTVKVYQFIRQLRNILNKTNAATDSITVPILPHLLSSTYCSGGVVVNLVTSVTYNLFVLISLF